jgi:hypothetical protein
MHAGRSRLRQCNASRLGQQEAYASQVLQAPVQDASQVLQAPVQGCEERATAQAARLGSQSAAIARDTCCCRVLVC